MSEDKPEEKVRWQDVVIDLSPEQKDMRLRKMRLELLELGYSVVLTDKYWEDRK